MIVLWYVYQTRNARDAFPSPKPPPLARELLMNVLWSAPKTKAFPEPKPLQPRHQQDSPTAISYRKQQRKAYRLRLRLDLLREDCTERLHGALHLGQLGLGLQRAGKRVGRLDSASRDKYPNTRGLIDHETRWRREGCRWAGFGLTRQVYEHTRVYRLLNHVVAPTLHKPERQVLIRYGLVTTSETSRWRRRMKKKRQLL